MAVIISMLRGVNVGSHHRIKMADLRAVYESLQLEDPQTFIQSGNVIFRTEERDFDRLTKRIADALESTFGFRPGVIVRTCSELRAVIAGNPFASRPGIEPSRLLVIFFTGDPGPEARDTILQAHADPEEFLILGRELYIYFPDGMAQPKLTPAVIEKKLKIFGTGRNWNSVTKMLEIAETLEASE